MLKILATRGEREVLREVAASELPALLAAPDVNVWLDCTAGDEEEAALLAREVFHFHPLAIEDCFGEREHPKVEGFDGYLFLITHGLSPGATPQDPQVVELDTFIGKRFLFTYHEKPSRSVAAVSEHCERNGGGPLRRGPAALLFAILDRQVDNIEPVLESLDTQIETLESRVMVRPRNQDLWTMVALKRSTLHLRRWMLREREVLLRFARNEFEVVSVEDAILFRSVHDHLQRFTDMLETQREMISSLHETYLSVVNLRLGHIMKFLTIFTAVLMPLTVVTGIYGMNFEHMPELKWRWGYPAAILLMAITASTVVWQFRRRGWIDGKDSDPPPPGVV